MPSQSCTTITRYLLILLLGISPAFTAELPTEDPPQGTLHPLLKDTIEAGPYAAQWASLVTHPTPA